MSNLADVNGAAPRPDQIVLEETVIGYGRALMRPLSLAIRRGDFWGIVGPNGAGKSTLIKTILGLIPPVRGKVSFPCGRVRQGYVPQRMMLNPAYPLTALEIVLMGCYDRLKLGCGPSAEDRNQAREELHRLGLATLEQRLYTSLSGGQQQRVLIARALASNPDVLILDEPITGLDLPGQADILAFLRELHHLSGKSILMIAHDLEQVAGVVTHLCLINKDADLCLTGTREELLDARRLSALYGRSVMIEPVPNGRPRIGVREAGHA